ncbi:hypothetical protein BSU04_00010 [Caballeronia sordidicola]|uniref:Uncharacterized protein n=2 Tax=Caballeronia sordidicola TaxID=196367 RepID=A0A226XBB7_CABSO|nr:hypothetical protein BSU04_00010 [Caballeronia sordidicola]
MKLLAWSEGLLEIIHRVQEENGHLRDEVAVLKGEKKRPTFKPSRMNEDAGKKIRGSGSNAKWEIRRTTRIREEEQDVETEDRL